MCAEYWPCFGQELQMYVVPSRYIVADFYGLKNSPAEKTPTDGPPDAVRKKNGKKRSEESADDVVTERYGPKSGQTLTDGYERITNRGRPLTDGHYRLRSEWPPLLCDRLLQLQHWEVQIHIVQWIPNGGLPWLIWWRLRRNWILVS